MDAGLATGDQQRNVITDSSAAAGLDWGGNFKAQADPPHFYSDPGNREEKIKDAAIKYRELNQ